MAARALLTAAIAITAISRVCVPGFAVEVKEILMAKKSQREILMRDPTHARSSWAIVTGDRHGRSSWSMLDRAARGRDSVRPRPAPRDGSRYDPEAERALQARRVWAKVPCASFHSMFVIYETQHRAVSSLCEVLQS
jgi:hypothetical protein